MSIIIGIACLLLGFLIAFPFRLKKIQVNEELQKQNQSIAEENEKLKQEKIEHRAELAEILNRQANAQESINSAVEKYKEVKLSEAQLLIDQDISKEKNRFEEAKEEYQKEYLTTLQDYIKTFQNNIEKIKQETSLTQKEFDMWKAKLAAAVEDNKRDNIKDNYYRINLSKEDSKEIEKLREIIPSFKDPIALRKVIWKVYYENPTTSLIGRVVGKEIVCGIYKITNLRNGMTYVGQSVDIADRWRQHIKRGLGADPPTKNKLYPAMLEDGVENFSFEIVEKCPKESLNEREKFWQDYFHSQDYGYSIR